MGTIESKFSRQLAMENYNYLKGTIISFAVIAVTLYLSLTRFYIMQLVSMMLIFVSFCIFCIYDIKYSNSLNDHQYLEIPLNFSGIQASCRQFILSTGITVFILVNLISVNTVLIQNKHFIFEIKFQYTLMGVMFYTFVNLFLFLKSKKNNAKVSPYLHIGIIITILSSLVIICYQIYIKVGMKYTINDKEMLVLQNKIDRLFILLMIICIIYSLVTFTLHNMSNKYKRILFTLSVLQHSLLLFVARHGVWFSKDYAANVHGVIYIGYIGIALAISMTLYYLETCIIRRNAQ